jgi:hypothetical protein
MKAVVLKEFGGPENLSLGDLTYSKRRAQDRSDSRCCRVGQSGRHQHQQGDTIWMRDVAGVIESVGDGVTGLAPGDEVFGCVGGVRGSGGTLAEYVLADARLLARKPQALSMREGGGLAARNVVSVFLHSVVVSWASRRFDRWLRPAGRDPKRDIAGVALVLSFYALFLVAFWQYELHVWRPW